MKLHEPSELICACSRAAMQHTGPCAASRSAAGQPTATLLTGWKPFTREPLVLQRPNLQHAPQAHQVTRACVSNAARATQKALAVAMARSCGCVSMRSRAAATGRSSAKVRGSASGARLLPSLTPEPSSRASCSANRRACSASRSRRRCYQRPSRRAGVWAMRAQKHAPCHAANRLRVRSEGAEVLLSIRGCHSVVGALARKHHQ